MGMLTFIVVLDEVFEEECDSVLDELVWQVHLALWVLADDS